MISAPGISVSGSASIEGQRLFGPLDLNLPAGRWTCLLGPSGVGKSTILRLIAHLRTGCEFTGTITADGQAITNQIAYMAQEDLLLPWATVRQNVGLGPRLRGEKTDKDRITRLLSRVGLTDHAEKKPHALSGGQRQRVALARTLMEDKPIILLDEPFSALDARTRADMQELAAELLTGHTVLLVTHDPAEAARLGHAIHVMTETGLTEFTPPPKPTPRAFDDPETLRVQGELMSLLRGARG